MSTQTQAYEQEISKLKAENEELRLRLLEYEERERRRMEVKRLHTYHRYLKQERKKRRDPRCP